MRCISPIPLALLIAPIGFVGPSLQDSPERVPVSPPPAAQPSAPQDATEVPHLFSNRDQWVVRVFEQDEEAPIAGASIWPSYSVGEEYLPLPETTTNAHGEAAIDLAEIRALPVIEQASVEIEAIAACPGYVTGHITSDADDYNWQETLADREEWDSLWRDLALVEGWSLTGRIVDSSGAPVYDAQVLAGIWNAANGGWQEGLESSDYLGDTEPGGHFSFDLGDSTEVEIYAGHHRAGHGHLVVSAESPAALAEEELLLELQRGELFLRGTLCGEDGWPLRRGRLLADHGGEPKTPYWFDFEVPVAEDGSFEVACPAPGAWELTTDYRHVLYREPGPEPVHLRIPGNHAVIRVVDEAGRPVRSDRPRVHAARKTSGGLRLDYRGKVGGENYSQF